MDFQRVFQRVGSRVNRWLLQSFARGYYSLPEKAASIANGEEVLLADLAFYESGFRYGLCLLVLTPTQLTFAPEFDSRGFPLDEYIGSVPLVEIQSVTYKDATLFEFIRKGRLAYRLEIRWQGGATITFGVDDARKWYTRLAKADDPMEQDSGD